MISLLMPILKWKVILIPNVLIIKMSSSVFLQFVCGFVIDVHFKFAILIHFSTEFSWYWNQTELNGFQSAHLATSSTVKCISISVDFTPQVLSFKNINSLDEFYKMFACSCIGFFCATFCHVIDINVFHLKHKHFIHWQFYDPWRRHYYIVMALLLAS